MSLTSSCDLRIISDKYSSFLPKFFDSDKNSKTIKITVYQANHFSSASWIKKSLESEMKRIVAEEKNLPDIIIFPECW